MTAKAKKSNKQLPSKKSTVSAVPSGSALRSGARDPNNDESDSNDVVVSSSRSTRTSTGGKGLIPDYRSSKRIAGSTRNITTRTTESRKKRARPKPRIIRRRMKNSTSDLESDGATTRVTAARSRMGHGGSYLWDLELLDISENDIREKLVQYERVKYQTPDGRTDFRLKAGQVVWILPDPNELPPITQDVHVDELNIESWWIGKIVGVYAVAGHTGRKQEPSNMGLMKVAWYYSGDHALALPNLHENWKKKIRRYRFDHLEHIESDHMDFVPMDCFAGFADGIATYLSIKGLEVDDLERIKAPALRKTSSHSVRMVGWDLKAMRQKTPRRVEREAEVVAESDAEMVAESDPEMVAECDEEDEQLNSRRLRTR